MSVRNNVYIILLWIGIISAQEDVFQLVEQQCAVPIIYAPWRQAYPFLQKKSGVDQEKKKCPFCREMQEEDDEHYFILRRFNYNLVALNIFPYAQGHLVIIPLEHRAQLKDLSPQARTEMMELATISLEILEQQYGVTSANVGLNIGTTAGASIADHLHMHIVPRSIIPAFMQVIGRTEVVSFDLRDVYSKLKLLFDTIKIK